MKTFKTYVSEKLQDLQQFDLLSDVRRPRTEKQLWRALGKYPYENLGAGFFSIAISGPEISGSKRYVIKVSKNHAETHKDSWPEWALACKNLRNPHLPVIHGLYPFFPPEEEFDQNNINAMIDDKVHNDMKSFKYGYYAVLDYIEIGEDEELRYRILDSMGFIETLELFAQGDIEDISNFEYFDILQSAFKAYFGFSRDNYPDYGFNLSEFFKIMVQDKPELLQAFSLAAKIYKEKGHGLDMHGGNFGLSESGHAIITDPFSWKSMRK